MKKKIIIFGATGNVGSYVLKYANDYFNKNEMKLLLPVVERLTFLIVWG